MPTIAPFKAYRYNEDKIRKFDDVLAPPYDVISKEQQEALYKKSPYNFVRLDFKKQADASSGNVYDAAARELEQWISSGVFRREDRDSIYVYVQTYKNQEGKKKKRVGFFALMEIDQKKVRKHEKTLTGPKVDRAALLERLRANMSPIFGLFEDPGKKVHAQVLSTAAKEKPIVDVTIDGVKHELYVENDPKRLDAIRKAIDKKPMYIADGHHRFEVSSQYREKHSDLSTPEGKGGRYVLTYLCASDHNDLTIYPTHRALKLDGDWARRMQSIVKASFKYKLVPSHAAMMKALDRPSKAPLLGVAWKEGEKGKIYFSILAPKKPTKDLDVMLADRLVIRPLTGEDTAGSGRIKYSRDAAEAFGWLKKGQSDLVIFLAKMPIKEIIRVSDAGVNLPQKSTYFYPKLLSGLVFYKF